MIIGLTGKKGAGKNAVAKLLALHAPKKVVEISFAAKLKDSAAVLLGCTVADLENWKNEPSRIVTTGQLVDGLEVVPDRTQTIREFLQHYGTEAHREIFGQDFWVDAALPLDGARAGATITYDDAMYVVTDVRFPNEADRVAELDGIIVQVVGPPEIEQSGDGHASEIPLDFDLIDYSIRNTKRNDNYASLDFEVRRLLHNLEAEGELL